MGLLDSSNRTSGTTTGPSASGLGLRPIIAHFMFPTALAVWLGTLFALALLAVRGAVLEQMVLNYDLDALLPFLSPPLGGMVRLMLAGMLGVVGAGLGYGLARMLQNIARPGVVRPAVQTAKPITPAAPHSTPSRDAQTHKADAAKSSGVMGVLRSVMASLRQPLVSRDAHPDAPTRAPIRAHEELGLSLGPVPVEPAPVPQTESAFAYAPAPHYAPEPAHEQPLVLDTAYEYTAPEAVLAPALPTLAPVVDAEPAPTHPRLAPAPLAPPVSGPSAAQRIASAPVAELTHVELVSRLASLMDRHHLPAEEPAPAPLPTTPAAEAPGADAKSNLLKDALAGLRALG